MVEDWQTIVARDGVRSPPRGPGFLRKEWAQAGCRRPHMAQHTVLLIVSDHLGWIGLRATLQSLAGVRMVGEARDRRQAVETAAQLNPDLVLMSSVLADGSALSLVAELRAVSPNSQFVVLADEFSGQEFMVLGDLGVAGYILWRDLTPATVAICLDAVLTAGLRVASRSAVEALLLAMRERRRPSQPAVSLDDRSRSILQRLAEGLGRAEIAEAEHLSLRTVDRTIDRLLLRLQAPSLFVLALKAERLGLLSPER